MSAAIRAMFDRIAPAYDALNRTMSLGIDRRWRRRAVDLLGALGEERVLDVCAGTGDLAAEVRRGNPAARVVAADFARVMLARGAAAGKVPAPVQADALRLPFATGAFAAVLCGFGVRNLDDPAAGLTEVRRVLRPGGRFVVLEFFRPGTRARRALHAVYNRNVLPFAGGLVSGDRAAYAYLARSMEGFLPRAHYEGLARAAGFAVEHAEDLFPGVASLLLLRRGGEPC